ncbi:uncharacterized protein LOC133194283 [Saccostrea echinata]|uniref:uncharacterized protein LOC133194283 n=1 Tax=Saccostrea echinata TaxID=191078 RepID=UPI002A80F3A4|nr:uncharacterized protein LOC133194283 [Saccostrea echinata]
MAKREERGCSRVCHNQWTLSSFGFNHDHPRDFITFQWGCPKLFIVWTISWCLLHVTVLALQPYFFREVLPNWAWFLFLTNWSYVVLAIYSIVESVSAIYVYVCRKDILKGDAVSTPWYFKFLWVLYYTTTTSAITVALLYYLTLDEVNDANSILKHFVNFVYVILNLILTRKPYRILHFYIPMIYSFVYIIFTLAYQIGFKQEAIYPTLDWNNIPNVFLYALGIPLVFAPLLTLTLYTLTVIRDSIGLQCDRPSTNDIMAKEEKKGCSHVCYNQWKLTSLGFDHDQPRDFVTFQWGSPKLFIAWTVLWGLLHITTLALQPYFNQEDLPYWKWFTKLTNWSYSILAIYSIVESVSAIYVFVYRKDIIKGEAESTPWYLQLVWVLYCLATTSAITVGLLFYLLLNDGNDASSILKHFINVVFVILNLVLTRKPFRILHFYIPIAYSFIYILFTCIYQKGFNQEEVYPVLDWNDIPNVFLYALGIPLLFIPLLVLVLFMLTFVRDTIGNHCNKLCRKTDTDIIV